MATGILLCEDEDLLEREPNLERVWPRFDANNARKRDWRTQISLATVELERRLRNHKDVPDHFSMGQLGLRSREQLRGACACLALHYIYVAADTMGDETGFFVRKAAKYQEEADGIFKAESIQLDYDIDNSGTVEDDELQLPMPARFIRG